MVSITGTTIKLTRGDTLVVIVSMTRAGRAYVPDENDVIRFALKRAAMKPDRVAYVDDEPLVTKTIPNDTLQLKLEPNDTKDLAFGRYVYDIEITMGDGSVDTFINNAELHLLPEVN